VISSFRSLHRLKQSRTLHTLTVGPKSGVHFKAVAHGTIPSHRRTCVAAGVVIFWMTILALVDLVSSRLPSLAIAAWPEILGNLAGYERRATDAARHDRVPRRPVLSRPRRPYPRELGGLPRHLSLSPSRGDRLCQRPPPQVRRAHSAKIRKFRGDPDCRACHS
jgi:hypothetical protein